MNKKNLTQPEVASYSSPTCKIVCVRTESVCQTGSYGEPGNPGGNAGNNPIYPEFED